MKKKKKNVQFLIVVSYNVHLPGEFVLEQNIIFLLLVNMFLHLFPICFTVLSTASTT